MASGHRPKSLCCPGGQAWGSGNESLQARGPGRLKLDVGWSSLCVPGQSLCLDGERTAVRYWGGWWEETQQSRSW